jgi:hypothetical protein
MYCLFFRNVKKEIDDMTGVVNCCNSIVAEVKRPDFAGKMINHTDKNKKLEKTFV